MSRSIIVDSSGVSVQPTWLPWLVCLSAGLFFFYEFFQLNVFDVINQFLRRDFHIDAAQLSWMSSAFVWANVLFLLPAGLILDRFSTRTVIIAALLLCILGTLGFGLTQSFAWATFFHAVTGIGNAFCFLSCAVLVVRWFPPRRRALLIGCIVTMAFVGGMMAHTPFAYLTEKCGWRDAVLIDAVVGMMILVWIFIIVQDKPDGEIVEEEIIAWWRNFKLSLSNRQNWLAGIYTSCLNLPIMVLCALWGASYLQTVHHQSAIVASNTISLIFMGSIIGCPLIGWLSDTQGLRKPWMMIGAITTFLIVILLALRMVQSDMSLCILFFALGFFSSTQVISYPLIAESNRTSSVGIATGMASVIIMGGGGVGQVLFGFLMQRHAGLIVSHYTAADFQFAIWMFPIAIFMAFLAILLTRETHCKSWHEGSENGYDS